MRLAICTLVLCLSLPFSVLGQSLTIEKEEDGVAIKVAGAPFARYIIRGHKKPVIWPILGPTGKEMTRAYPFKSDVEGEKKDHPHHESFWFDHGDVNGTDFWSTSPKSGEIRHREFLKMEEGTTALLVIANDWLADGKKVCEDTRAIRFGANDAARWIDFEVEVVASEGELRFGQTKEGSFGLRVPTSMDVDSKKGGVIINSEGLKDSAAWGKPAKWVDYSGPVGGETLGIAIFNHPSSFRFPTTWHVRTYGLFAANPFGGEDFKIDPAAYGEYKLPAGAKLRLAYRVLFHKGDAAEGKVEQAFEEYAKTPLTLP